ncbi:MAG: endonuclease/exonuclease/phosphatase family protein, partial [Bacteroidetes bacterium]|nr:endonuclease/exonuclease/phosphatase family protein [Bacteroidota bacterium]
MNTYLFFRINIIVAFFAVIAYLSSYVPPDIFWLSAIFALSIPVMLLLNLFFIIYWFLKKSFRSILSITVLLLGIKFIKSTFIPGFDLDNQNFSLGLVVVSYNVRVFNTYAHLRDKNNDSSAKMIDWLADINSDIMCLQEFFYDKKSDIFNSIDKISEKRKGRYYFSIALTNSNAQFGIITFSKFPIINKGDLDFGNNTLNQATYIDVIINKSADTIRIYNIHLQSLLIKGKDIFEYAEERNDILSKSKNLLHLFKTVSILRSRQLDILIRHINNSPYAVVVCGDLNDTPYSYTYQTLNKTLNNAFEKAGNGFGFTYNSKFPFLRI